MLVHTRSFRVWITLMFISTLVGCASDIHKTVVTTQNVNEVRSDVLNATNLNDLEKQQFARALNRSSYQPYGKSVAQILSEEQALEVAAARAAAAEALVKATLDHDIVIRPKSIDIGIQYSEYGGIDEGPYQDQDTLSFTATNLGKKFVSSFSATATLTNQGGDSLYSGTLQDFNIAPGQTHTFAVHISGVEADFDPQLARTTPIGDAVVSYTVDQIRYADGTSISRSSP